MLLRRYISVLLIAIYAIVFSHDFMPHHHHTDACASHDHHHNSSSHSDDCQFPFHKHSMDEAGVFLNNSGIVINFDINNISPKELFSYADVIEFENDKILIDYILPVYKGPDLTSFSYRGPPLS